MTKTIAIFCDGTWNRSDAPHPTNVVLLRDLVLPQTQQGRAQETIYVEGVGTGKRRPKWIDSLLGGALGTGLMENLEEAYSKLVQLYEEGDQIYLFGFSRGAYTARSLGGLIRNVGILERDQLHHMDTAIALYKSRQPDDHPDRGRSCAFRARYSPGHVVSQEDRAWRTKFRPDLKDAPDLRIQYMGLWDTVGALGVPAHFQTAGLFNKRHRFHDAKISAMVASARHAQAIDEYRKIFIDSPWDDDKLEYLNGQITGDQRAYLQVWFPGGHGSVGGGGEIKELSNDALKWIAEGAMQQGLELDQAALSAHQDNHTVSLRNQKKKGLLDNVSKRPRRGPYLIKDVSRAACLRWHEPAGNLHEKIEYRPAPLGFLGPELKKVPTGSVGTGTGGS